LNNPSSNNDQAIPDDWVDLHDNTDEDFVDVGLPSAPTTTTATADEGNPSSNSPSPLLTSRAPGIMAGNSHDLGPSSPSSTSGMGLPDNRTPLARPTARCTSSQKISDRHNSPTPRRRRLGLLTPKYSSII
jgi:hypothetical protein